jgi:multicomponent Na+:H+ antiporter subunit D
MILANLPALQVLVPLLAAPICSLLLPRRFAWAFAALITFITLACSMALLQKVYESGTISYAYGGWIAPFGIEYKIDALSSLFIALVSGVAAFAIIYALPAVEKEIAT